MTNHMENAQSLEEMPLYVQTVSSQVKRNEITFNFGDSDADGYVCSISLTPGKLY